MVNITYDFTTGFFPWGTNTSLRKANDLVTFPTTVSSSPTLQCKLIIKSSLLFLNPLVAALWKGNTYPFLRCSIKDLSPFTLRQYLIFQILRLAFSVF